jgi:hypothetical protein
LSLILLLYRLHTKFMWARGEMETSSLKVFLDL